MAGGWWLVIGFLLDTNAGLLSARSSGFPKLKSMRLFFKGVLRPSLNVSRYRSKIETVLEESFAASVLARDGPSLCGVDENIAELG